MRASVTATLPRWRSKVRWPCAACVCTFVRTEGSRAVWSAHLEADPLPKVWIMPGQGRAGPSPVSARSLARAWRLARLRTLAEKEIIDLVEVASCTVEGFYGVRCVCGWLPNEPKP
jgi:hypothetical protein